MKHTKIIMVVLSIAIVCIAGYFLFYALRQPEIEVNGTTFRLEVADTPKARELGLSGHLPLSDRQGMLFVFPKNGSYSFWMKDMSFALDIIWLNENFEVVHIEKNLSPSTYPTTFGEQVSSRYVLEINAGLAERIGIVPGIKAVLKR